jgi:FG-GAP repeat
MIRTRSVGYLWISIVIGIALSLGVVTAAASSTEGRLMPSAISMTAKDPSLVALHAPIELTSPHPKNDSAFGFSVAAGTAYVAVGSPEATARALPNAGNVSVFNATTGHIIATFSSPNPKVDGYFGWSVALSGSTLVVGAPNETARGSYLNAGNAYVYTISSSAVTLSSKLVEPHPQVGNSSVVGGAFGYSVAVSGSYLVVGAAGETASADARAGNAYVFATNGTFVGTLMTPNPVLEGLFGVSVAISGSTAYVGAPGEGSGHAYIILKATGPASGTTTYTLASPNAENGAEFGLSVAVSGSYLVVGAPYENTSGTDYAGTAYLFSSTTGLLTTALTNPDPQSNGAFGSAVAATGADIVVGAPNDDAFGALEGGNVTIFNGNNGTVATEIASPNFCSYGQFGYALAASGSTIVIGAPGESANGYSSVGHAYIY